MFLGNNHAYKWRMAAVAKRVGAMIRAFREAEDLSREQLAERAGIHPNYLGSVERGETNAGIENIARIAKALKVPPHRLLMPKANDTTDEVWALISTADPKTSALMVKVVRALKDWRKT